MRLIVIHQPVIDTGGALSKNSLSLFIPVGILF